MALVNDRMNASKPPPNVDPKSGKLAPGQINNNKDLDVEVKQSDSFFGSFFSASKNAPKKKGVAVMDAVSLISRSMQNSSFNNDFAATPHHSTPSCSQ